MGAAAVPAEGRPNAFSRTVVNIAQTNRNQDTEADEKQVAPAFGGSQDRFLPKGQGARENPHTFRE